MSLRESRRKVEEREQEARRTEDAARRERERIVLEDTLGIIGRWNEHLAHGRRPLISPTLGAALATGHRWLFAFCPGCHLEKDLDLARLDQHPGTTIDVITARLSCQACRPNAPFARPIRLGHHSIREERQQERQRALEAQWAAERD